MKVNQVLSVFLDPSEEESEASRVWLLVADGNNREGYLCLDFEKYPAFEQFANVGPMGTDADFKRAADLLRADDSIEDFSKRPHLEEASPAMQFIFDELEGSDSITHFVDEENCDWEDLGLSREEFEKQIDTDIQKFGLDEVVCKYNSDGALYTCYGDLLCSFSREGGVVLGSEHQNDEANEISSLVPDGGKPMVSVSFVPVDFQRDKGEPFKICEIMDRSDQDNPAVTYVVIRDGKDEAIFSASSGKLQQRDHAFFSALDYIADVYRNDPALAMQHFDGAAYTKKYYDISMYSNPATRLQYSPLALDAHWKQAFPDYSTDKVFGDAIVNGELTAGIISEIENAFNSSLNDSSFRLTDPILADIEKLPPISEVCVLDDNSNIISTPLFAAAQYEWEKERASKIFDSTNKELFAFLSSLDSAMEKHGPTLATLDCFSELLNDFCYGREEMLKDMEIPSVSMLGTFKNLEAAYNKCHKVLKLFDQSFIQDKNAGQSL